MKTRRWMLPALLVAGLCGWSGAATGLASTSDLPLAFVPLAPSRPRPPWLYGAPQWNPGSLIDNDSLQYRISPSLSLSLHGQQIEFAQYGTRYSYESYAYELRYVPAPALALSVGRVDGGTAGHTRVSLHYAPHARLSLRTAVRAEPSATSTDAETIYRPWQDASVRLTLTQRREEGADHAGAGLHVDARWAGLRLSAGYQAWETRRPGSLEIGTFQTLRVSQDRGAWFWALAANSHEAAAEVGTRRGRMHIVLRAWGNPPAASLSLSTTF
ncbi:MAG: hypothetical protein HY660_18215 [Armatimonadetes bacterium]|nr:hypothetical protein [Armatimonadota bacterium]